MPVDGHRRKARVVLPDRTGGRLRRRVAARPARSATATTTFLRAARRSSRAPGSTDVLVVMARLEDEKGVHRVPAASAASSCRPTRPASATAGRNRRWAGTASPRARSISTALRCPSAIASARKARVSRSRCGGSTAAASTSPPARSARRRARSIAARYMPERQQFGQAISQFQALQFKLADMATELVAARRWCGSPRGSSMRRIRTRRRTARWPSASPPTSGFDVCNEALQLHGGYGYINEYPLERHVARQPRAPDPRRHQRNHARDHRAPGIDGRGNRGDSMISSTTDETRSSKCAATRRS